MVALFRADSTALLAPVRSLPLQRGKPQLKLVNPVP